MGEKFYLRRKCCQGPPAICWRPLTAFPLKNLDNVSSIGSGAGIAASSRRRSTSKGTLNKFFNNSGNFLSPHVYKRKDVLPIPCILYTRCAKFLTNLIM